MARSRRLVPQARCRMHRRGPVNGVEWKEGTAVIARGADRQERYKKSCGWVLSSTGIIRVVRIGVDRRHRK